MVQNVTYLHIASVCLNKNEYIICHTERKKYDNLILLYISVKHDDDTILHLKAVSKLRQFRSSHICLCHSEVTLKAGRPFYLVSMPGEVNDPTMGVDV